MTARTDAIEEGSEELDDGKTHHIDVPLGEALRIERDARGLTQKALAAALDISASTIQKYEEGNLRISAARLWQLCNFLGVDVADFFKDLPHHVARPLPEPPAGVALNAVREDPQVTFVMNDGNGRKAAAVARAAAKLNDGRLDIALDPIKALRPKPKADV